MVDGSNPTLLNNLIQGNQSIGASAPDFEVFEAYPTPLTNATNNFIGSMSTNAVNTTTNIIGNTQTQLGSVVGVNSNGNPSGGPIYYPLLANTASIGAGTTTVLSTIASVEGTTVANTTDEIGNPRSSNGSIDLGAVQYLNQSVSAPTITVNPSNRIMTAGASVSFTAVPDGSGRDGTLTFTPTVKAASQTPASYVPPFLGPIDEFFKRAGPVNATGTMTVTYPGSSFTLNTIAFDRFEKFVISDLLGLLIPTWDWSE
jgi:hypothetical protein